MPRQKTSRQKTRTPKRKSPPNGSEPLVQPSMISTDCGNGKYAVWRVVNGKFMNSTLPHGRAKAAGTTVNADDLIATKSVDYVEWLGVEGYHKDQDQIQPTRYAVGEDMYAAFGIIETARNIQERYGGDPHIFSIINGVAQLGVDASEPLKLIVPVPPGLLNQVTDRVKKNITAGESQKGEGGWSIKPKGSDEWITFYIDGVMVVPEGAGIYAAYAIDIDGRAVNQPYMRDDGFYVLSGHVEVVDLGYGTADTYGIYNGELKAEEIEHATDADGGIQTHLVTPILREVREAIQSAHVTEWMVDSWLREWIAAGNTEDAANQIVSGKNLNMHATFWKYSKQYAEFVADTKLSPAFRRGADTIAAGGGGWYYVEKFILPKFPKRRILLPSTFEHTRWIPLHAMQAYGGLTLLAARLRRMKGN